MVVDLKCGRVKNEECKGQVGEMLEQFNIVAEVNSNCGEKSDHFILHLHIFISQIIVSPHHNNYIILIYFHLFGICLLFIRLFLAVICTFPTEREVVSDLVLENVDMRTTRQSLPIYDIIELTLVNYQSVRLYYPTLKG